MATKIAANIPYVSNAGIYRQLDVWAPNGTASLKYPAVLMFHGGGHVQGDKNDAQPLGVAKGLADKGFIVFNANYRLAPGLVDKPVHWREETTDIVAAAAWIKANGGAYRAKGLPALGVLGGSAGATHAAWLMSSNAGAGQCQVGCCWSGGYDYSDPNADPTTKQLNNTETYVGCTFEACPDEYTLASPIHYVPTSATLGPLLLLNEDAEVAPVSQAQGMKDAYDARVDLGPPLCTLTVFPGTQHAFAYSALGLPPSADFLHAVLGS